MILQQELCRWHHDTGSKKEKEKKDTSSGGSQAKESMATLSATGDLRPAVFLQLSFAGAGIVGISYPAGLTSYKMAEENEDWESWILLPL